MKKLMLIGAVLFSFSLMSFVGSYEMNRGVKKLGERYYEISPNANLSDSDEEKIAEYITGVYKIEDWRSSSQTLTFDMMDGVSE